MPCREKWKSLICRGTGHNIAISAQVRVHTSPASMYTSKKVHLGEKPMSLERTNSGGVRDPADPNHFPTLGGSKDAVGNASNPIQAERRLSRMSGSFKDTVLMEKQSSLSKLQVGTEGSTSTAELRRARAPERPELAANSSPRIAAERAVQGADANIESATRIEAGRSPSSSQQVSKEYAVSLLRVRC